MAAAAASAAASAPAPAPISHADFLDSVVRCMHRPTIVTSEAILALPLPAGLPDLAAADQLRNHGCVLFSRLFCQHEQVAFDLLASPHSAPPTAQQAQSLAFVLRCRRIDDHDSPPVFAHELAAATGDNLVRQYALLCEWAHTTPDHGWLAAFRTVQAFVAAPWTAEEPEADVLAAWNRIAFDRREHARDALSRRRARAIIQRQHAKLFHQAPMPGHPNKRDAEVHFDFLAHFGTLDEMRARVQFEPVADRQVLMLALRAAFPQWVPQRSDGREIEVFSDDRLAARQPEWERDLLRFDRNVLDYLRFALDTDADRMAALAAISRIYGARVTPLMIYLTIEMRQPVDAAFTVRQFRRTLALTWLPHARPDRDAIVVNATAIHAARGDNALGSFLLCTVPMMLNWPCAADTAFLGALLAISPDPVTRTALLVSCLESKVPEGAQHMSRADVDRFLAPLLQCIPDDARYRVHAMCSFIRTWTQSISDEMANHMRQLVQFAHTRDEFDRHVQRQRISVGSAAIRHTGRVQKLTLRARHIGPIRDVVAPENASDEAACIVCSFRMRRVCFTPCGHIITCIECAAKCRSICPVCRAAIAHAQPCIVPQA